METTITKWIVILTILSIDTWPVILINGQEQVPCLFFFGDSQFDNGNNNGLITVAKVNYPPYGVDYPGAVATGRFSNGLSIPDYLALLLGFTSIPLFATTTGSAICKGLNYASGGSGILDSSGINLGDRFSMNRQLLNHQTTIDRISGFRGSQAAARDHLRKCLYVVNMGSNDYINNYYLPPPLSPSIAVTPDRFADKLINTFSHQLRTLYSQGARKVAVFGIGLIGCIPQELSHYPPTNGSPCVDKINNAVGLFNYKLVSLINDLNAVLPNAQFTYINSTNIALGDPSLVGLKVLNAPCCVVQANVGQCVRNGGVCSNRDEYAFFDNFHPTQILNNATASRSYTALSPLDSHPLDIRTLAHN